MSNEKNNGEEMIVDERLKALLCDAAVLGVAYRVQVGEAWRIALLDPSKEAEKIAEIQANVARDLATYSAKMQRREDLSAQWGERRADYARRTPVFIWHVQFVGKDVPDRYYVAEAFDDVLRMIDRDQELQIDENRGWFGTPLRNPAYAFSCIKAIGLVHAVDGAIARPTGRML